MTVVPKIKMSADEFIAWAMNQAGRYELVRGEIVPMSPERLGHTETKGNVYVTLRQALRACRGPCRAYTDGLAVRIDEDLVYEPDALVRCGDPLDDNNIEITDPVIVVEVVSPSSRAVDAGGKLQGYFRLESVHHYLIVDSKTRTVIQHARSSDGRIETRILRSGALALEPPGLSVEIESFFAS